MKTSKVLLLIVILLFPVLSIYSQSALNYQGVVRDASGHVYSDEDVTVRFTVLDASLVSLYTETDVLTTNALGYINTLVGDADVSAFALLNWSSGDFSLKVELDRGSDGTYEIDKTIALASVPYALYGKDEDADPANELQTLSLNTNQLSISGSGSSVSLASYVSPWTANASDLYYSAGDVGIGISSPEARLDVVGDARIHGGLATGGQSLELSLLGSGNRHSYIDFHGDDIYTDFSFRIIRGTGGENAYSRLHHRGTGPFQFYNDEPAPFDFYTNSEHRVRIDELGRVGIGTTSPTSQLEVAGTIKMQNDFEIWRSGTALHLRQDGTNSWISNIADFVGNGSENNGSLYLIGQSGIQLRTGVGSGAGVMGLILTNQGRIGMGISAPESKLHIQGEASWADEDPLFQVKNSDGVPVFAVYNNGVRILVEDDPNAKGRPRGGFSVGGFDRANKSFSPTYDFMRITPDSIRFNINNSASKGPRGGFAVGGFDRANKGTIGEDFLYITPRTSDDGYYNTFVGFHAGQNNQSGGIYNAFYGYSTGASNTTGDNNVYMGYRAGTSSTTASDNVFVGMEAGLRVSTGYENIMIGKQAGVFTTSGYRNTFLGSSAGYYNTTGHSNTFLGLRAGMGNREGYRNVMIGEYSGNRVYGGNSNTYIGYYSGRGAASNNASRNVGIGAYSGYSCQGFNNVFLGHYSGHDNIGGNNNIMIGYGAGANNLGSGNIFIGFEAGNTYTGSNRLYIDNSATTEPLIFGYFEDDWVKINGQLRVRDVPYGNQRDLQWNSTNGLLYYDNSSMRFKENITELTDDFSALLTLSPKTYTRPDAPEVWEIGYIAEEFEAAGLTKLVWYDEEGRPDGINYSKIILFSNENIKENRSRVEELEQEVEDLKNELSDLKQMVSALMEERK